MQQNIKEKEEEKLLKFVEESTNQMLNFMDKREEAFKKDYQSNTNYIKKIIRYLDKYMYDDKELQFSRDDKDTYWGFDYGDFYEYLPMAKGILMTAGDCIGVDGKHYSYDSNLDRYFERCLETSFKKMRKTDAENFLETYFPKLNNEIARQWYAVNNGLFRDPIQFCVIVLACFYEINKRTLNKFTKSYSYKKGQNIEQVGHYFMDYKLEHSNVVHHVHINGEDKQAILYKNDEDNNYYLIVVGTNGKEFYIVNTNYHNNK